VFAAREGGNLSLLPDSTGDGIDIQPLTMVRQATLRQVPRPAGSVIGADEFSIASQSTGTFPQANSPFVLCDVSKGRFKSAGIVCPVLGYSSTVSE